MASGSPSEVLAAFCLPRRFHCTRVVMARLASAHAAAPLPPTARRLPVKAKPYRVAPRSVALRPAPALTGPPAWAVTGCASRGGPSLSRMKQKRSRIQTAAAFVPPGHGSGGRLVRDLPTRPAPLGRCVPYPPPPPPPPPPSRPPPPPHPHRPRPAHPVKVAPDVAPGDGAPRRPGDGAAHRAELVAPSRGPHGSRRRSGVRLLGSEKALTLVDVSTTPQGIEQAHPLIG